MAIKDWKKIEKDKWKKGSKVKYIKKYPSDLKKKANQVYYIFGQNTGQDKYAFFRTKSQALKSIKAYMRKH